MIDLPWLFKISLQYTSNATGKEYASSAILQSFQNTLETEFHNQFSSFNFFQFKEEYGLVTLSKRQSFQGVWKS